MGRDGEIRYKAAVNDPGVFRLTKTMLREDPEEKVVRVLRSWKLRSKLAPKAGLRYDGLYVSLLSKRTRLRSPLIPETATATALSPSPSTFLRPTPGTQPSPFPASLHNPPSSLLSKSPPPTNSTTGKTTSASNSSTAATTLQRYVPF